MKSDKKIKKINIRLSYDEYKKLTELSSIYKVTFSDLVRGLIEFRYEMVLRGFDFVKNRVDKK